MKYILIALLVVFSASDSFAQLGFHKPKDPELSLGITHLLPSALPIPAGVVVLGTTSGAGFLNIFDVSTNLYLDFEQVFNVTAKVNVYKSDIIAAAVFGSFYSQTVANSFVDVNGVTQQNSLPSTAITPGAVFSYRMRRWLTGHVGGMMVFRSPPINRTGLPRSALIQGNTIYKEFTFGFSPTVALAVGGTYDLTYSIWGAGATVQIGGFQLGAHYYFNVSEGSLLPIVGGGYTANLD